MNFNINFARLNHILIPTRKEGRDRFRRSALGRLARPGIFLYEALSAEGRVVATTMLIAGGFGFQVGNTETYVLFSALAAVLFASIVFTRFYRMRGVKLEVRAPPRVGVGEEITFRLVATNDGAREEQALRFTGPFLPWDGRWTKGTAQLASLTPHATDGVEMRARFVQRGEHHLDPFHVAATVPFGLALGPPVRTGGCRFIVVPRIANVARVTTPMGRRFQPGGTRLASKTGESMELVGVRPYRNGDPVRDLHARSWAKVGVPLVREYRQEYFTRVGVVLDCDHGAADERRFEAAVSLAAGVLARLTRGEALIDLLVVGDQAHALTLGRSLGSFERALDLLACVEEPRLRRGPPRFSAELLLERIEPHLPRLQCVFFVALGWEERRAAFVERVRAEGVGASTFVVTAKEEGPLADGVSAVSAPAIERGEGLFL
jgi:uncharacterized protein (DUF58 family)